MADAKRDNNSVAAMLGVSDLDGETLLPVLIDPTTGRILMSTDGISGYSGTSTTELTIATGDQSFTTQAGLAYLAGARARITSAAHITNYMEGLVASYDSTTGAMVLTVDVVGGSGTLDDWNLNLAGNVGSTPTPRIVTIISNANPTIDTDSYDVVTITAQAVDIASMTTNLSGAPANFQQLLFRIKDDGTARAITWGAKFVPWGVALPTTTVAGKLTTVGFMYNSVTSVWGCLGALTEL